MNAVAILAQIKLTILGFAEAVLALRVLPSIIVVGYAYLVWKAWLWISATHAPDGNALGVFTAILGVATVVAGLYIRGGDKFGWGKFNDIVNTTTARLNTARKAPNKSPPTA